MLIVARAVWVVTLVFALAFEAHADNWVRAEVREVFSASRDHFVRVTPGTSWGDTFGFSGAAKGPYASAEFYRRQADRSYKFTHTATLLNPVAPVEIFVANDGRLLTIDNWHNRGYGEATVAIYGADGKVVRAHTLANFLSIEEIEALPHSASSIDWHDGPTYLNADQKTLYVMIRSGVDLVIGVETGRYAYCETREGRYVCRDSTAERKWRPYADVVPAR